MRAAVMIEPDRPLEFRELFAAPAAINRGPPAHRRIGGVPL